MFHHEIIDLTDGSLPFKIIHHTNANNMTYIPRHWHRSFEISYTLVGEITKFTINGKDHRTKAGAILLINPNEIHSVESKPVKDTDNQALSLIIPYQFMAKIVPNYPYRYYEIPAYADMSESQVKDFHALQETFTALYQISLGKDVFQNMKILSLVYNCLYLLTTSFSAIKHYKNDLIPETDEFDWIDSVIAYIEDHITEDLTVSQLASYFNLTASYFSRKFKKYTCLSVMAYIGEMRLQAAFQLLTNTDYPIQYIADNCGFPNHKAFIQIFKDKYQMTPSKYRQKLG